MITATYNNQKQAFRKSQQIELDMMWGVVVLYTEYLLLYYITWLIDFTFMHIAQVKMF